MAETGGGVTEVINAPVDKIVDALMDFDSYPEWQGSVLRIEVLERDAEGRGSLIHMNVDAKIKKLQYTVRYTYDLPNGYSWEQTEGDLKENTGRYSFKPLEDGSTEVTVETVTEVGFFVPAPMKKLIAEQSMKNSIRELKKRVEG